MRTRFASKDEKRRLENVFDVVLVAQDATASSDDARAMALNQCHESGLLAKAHESLQQNGVANLSGHRLARPPMIIASLY
jgi:hypothetical protein